MRQIYFALRHILLRGVLSVMSLRMERLRGGRLPPSLEGLREKANWRALPPFSESRETGTRLQVNLLTPISRRPRSRRSPWLRQTRATLRASRPAQAKQLACFGRLKLLLCRTTNLLCAKAHSSTGGTQRNELANGASKRGAAAPFFGRPS